MSYPVDLSTRPEVTGFFDPATNTISYVVKDPGVRRLRVVDSVMDLDYAAGRIAYRPRRRDHRLRPRAAASASSG